MRKLKNFKKQQNKHKTLRKSKERGYSYFGSISLSCMLN